MLAFVVAMLPFGMLAAFALPSVGGFSLLASHVGAAVLVGLVGLRAALDAIRGHRPQVPLEALMLAIFAVYSVFAATVLVRLFEGQFDVFTLGRGATGVLVSFHFWSVLVPVGPTSSNISQSAYILLTFLFFVAATSVLRKTGFAFAERWLRIAAITNIALGVLDFIGLDALLAPLRTASFALANNQVLAGLPRVIGGFPEPSSYGAFTAAIFAYFCSCYLYSGRRIDGLVALGSFILVIMSTAATAFAALGAVLLILLWRVRATLYASFRRDYAMVGGVVLCIGIAITSSAVIATPVPDLIERIFLESVVNKAVSESGLERGAWAANGIEAFWRTYGLGVGVGSLRSNGILSVLLGSVGLPGLLAFGAFLALAFLRPMPKWASGEARRAHSAAYTAAVAVVAAMLVSATTPDPGLLLVLLAAIALTARSQTSLSVHERGTSQH
ncbi:MAG: hypothetical protein AAGB11_13230 [Pseudomonadota bacterium]